jgi:glycosyltransferase involved in cell wall biosynthesis
MLNILYLTQLFSSRSGGSLVFYELAKALSQRGYQIHVICNLSTETDFPNLHIHKVKPLVTEPSLLPTSLSANIQYIINSIFAGMRIINEFDIDIIHTNSYIPIIAGGILNKIRNKPVVITVHDVFTGSASDEWEKWRKFNNLPRYYGYLGRLLEKICLSIPVNVVHSVSDTTTQDIHNINSKLRVETIYNSVDPSNYNSIKEIEYDDFVLFIGRLVFYKNVEILIEAFRLLSKESNPAQLVIVGDGPMKEYLISLTKEFGISNNVIFLGSVSNDEKVEYLRKCSALALPSTFEGFGLVILEAFIMRKPVLVSNIKPFDEIVDDNLNGYLISPDDYHAWAQKIKQLIPDKDKCREMGEAGYIKYKEKFDFTKAINRMETLYMKLINNYK